jgi:hypothetical protein
VVREVHAQLVVDRALVRGVGVCQHGDDVLELAHECLDAATYVSVIPRSGEGMVCSCCGEERTVVALRANNDVRLCRSCVDWLARQLGVISTPTLPVTDLSAAIAFYENAGFSVRGYREPDGQPGGYANVDLDGRSVFDLGVEDIDPASNRAAVIRS